MRRSHRDLYAKILSALLLIGAALSAIGVLSIHMLPAVAVKALAFISLFSMPFLLPVLGFCLLRRHNSTAAYDALKSVLFTG